MKSQDAMRELILSRGVGVASAQGWSALSIGDLARELDLSRSVVLALFDSRDALQLAVLDHAATWFIKDVVESGSKAADGEARVRALFSRWIAWARSLRLKGGCPFVHASAEAESLAQPARARLKEVLDGWSEIFRQALNHMRAAEGRSDIDTEQMIFELYGLYLSHHFWHWSMRDSQAEYRTMRAFDRLLRPARAAA